MGPRACRVLDGKLVVRVGRRVMAGESEIKLGRERVKD